MFGFRRKRVIQSSGRHAGPPTLDLTVPEGRHRLTDGDTVAVNGYPLNPLGWNDATRLLPTLDHATTLDPNPLMTPGQEHRGQGWRFCNG